MDRNKLILWIVAIVAVTALLIVGIFTDRIEQVVTAITGGLLAMFLRAVDHFTQKDKEPSEGDSGAPGAMLILMCFLGIGLASCATTQAEQMIDLTPEFHQAEAEYQTDGDVHEFEAQAGFSFGAIDIDGRVELETTDESGTVEAFVLVTYMKVLQVFSRFACEWSPAWCAYCGGLVGSPALQYCHEFGERPPIDPGATMDLTHDPPSR